jgi:hypothetical protein
MEIHCKLLYNASLMYLINKRIKKSNLYFKSHLDLKRSFNLICMSKTEEDKYAFLNRKQLRFYI